MEVRTARNSNANQAIAPLQNKNPQFADQAPEPTPRSFLVRPAPNQLRSAAPRNLEASGIATPQNSGSTLSEFQSLLAQSLREPSPGQAPTDQVRQDDAVVSEEQLQNGLVEVLLGELGPEALASYQRSFAEALTSGAGAEDAVKFGLQGAVADGTISLVEAESVNGLSFQAAQLDDNLEMLFDNRGSATDQTIAVLPLADALAKAEANLAAATAEGATAASRSLDAPSNNVSATTAVPPPPGGAGPSQRSDASLAGFLWKPRSERDGNLVVLFPSSLTGSVESAAIFGSLPPTSTSFIESGRFSSINNGNRSHFRFSKPGGEYPDGAYVVAQLKDGSSVAIQVADSNKRVTVHGKG